MKAKLDARAVSANYTAAFQRLKQLPGFNHQVVLRAEMGSILSAWAARTPAVSNDEAIQRGSRLRALRQIKLTQFGAGQNAITINAGVRKGARNGVVWIRGKNGKPHFAGVANVIAGTVALSGNRRANTPSGTAITSRAAQVSSEYPKSYKEVYGSVGIARQSVVQIAESLGIDLAQVQGGGIGMRDLARAKGAVAANQKFYQNGIGSQGGDGVAAFIQGTNTLPYNNRIGMDRVLASVMMGRAKFIEQSYQKGAFASIANTARAFPNIKFSP